MKDNRLQHGRQAATHKVSRKEVGFSKNSL